MSFCFLYTVVLKNHVQDSPWWGEGSIGSSRSNVDAAKILMHFVIINTCKNKNIAVTVKTQISPCIFPL